WLRLSSSSPRTDALAARRRPIDLGAILSRQASLRLVAYASERALALQAHARLLIRLRGGTCLVILHELVVKLDGLKASSFRNGRGYSVWVFAQNIFDRWLQWTMGRFRTPNSTRKCSNYGEPGGY